MNVLIADDNVVMRNLLKFHLKHYNLDIVEVSDGLKAIEEFQRIDYDILFLDLNMPNLDGLNVAHFIKEAGVETHIIIISSNLNSKSVNSFLQLGIKHFLTKPLDQKKLKEIMEKIIK